jgi:hypothetical protein
MVLGRRVSYDLLPVQNICFYTHCLILANKKVNSNIINLVRGAAEDSRLFNIRNRKVIISQIDQKGFPHMDNYKTYRSSDYLCPLNKLNAVPPTNLKSNSSYMLTNVVHTSNNLFRPIMTG